MKFQPGKTFTPAFAGIVARCAACIALVLAASMQAPAAARAAAARASSAEEEVVLPPLIVTEVRGGPRWRYLELPGFEVLSACDDERTTRYLAGILRQHELLEAIIPATYQSQWSAPRLVIFYGHEMSPPLPRELAATLVARRTVRVENLDTTALERLTTETERSLRAMPNLWMADVDLATTYASLPKGDALDLAEVMQPRTDHFESVRVQRALVSIGVVLQPTAEYVRSLLERRAPPLPPWMVDVASTLFHGAEFKQNTIVLPPLVWVSAEETRALLKSSGRGGALIPMDEIFAERETAEPSAGDEQRRLLRRAQRELFVRWCFYGKGAPRREAFWRLAERAGAGPIDEAAFKACLGIGYADAFERLADYLPRAAREPLVVRQPQPARKLPALKLRDASRAEVARIKGEWERLESRHVAQSHPDLVARYADQSRESLRHAWDQGDRDPGLAAALGLWECEYGDPAAARELLERATTGLVLRPRAYVELARLQLSAALADAESNGGAVDPTAAVGIIRLLDTARALSPPIEDAYELYAALWSKGAVAGSPENLAALAEGVRFFPENPRLVIQAAMHHARLGRRDEADRLLALGLRFPADEKARASLHAFQEHLSSNASSRAAP